MSGFGRRLDGPRGRRRAAREGVAYLGSAVSLDGSTSVLVEDLSSSGARVRGRGLPATGKQILIRTDRLSLFGRVAWAHDDHRGIIVDE